MEPVSGWYRKWAQGLRSRSSPPMLSRRGHKGHNREETRYWDRREGGPQPEAALASTPRCVLAHKLHPTSQLKPKPDRCPSEAKKPDVGEKKSSLSSWTWQLFSSERHEESWALLFYLSLPALITAAPLRKNRSLTERWNKGIQGFIDGD